MRLDSSEVSIWRDLNERAFAEELFEGVRVLTADASGGVTRPSYSFIETDALVEISARASAYLRSNRMRDVFGNLWIGRSPTVEQPCVVIGSHIDSVKCGGNYDGLAGIVAGILVLRRLPPDAPVSVVALRGEEGAWFDLPYKGSRALFGKLRNPSPLLHAAMLRTAANPNGVSLSPSAIRAFFELHIEQGPVLEEERQPIGVVTDICGSVRFRVRALGEAGHSGTTPLYMRRDAVRATVKLLSECYSWMRDLDGVLLTCGVLTTDAATHAMTRIADRVDFTVDIRSSSEAQLRMLSERFSRLSMSAEDYCHVKFECLSQTFTAPVELRSDLVVAPEGTTPLRSGAGHDAAVFAEVGVPSAMIFVRNANGSHNSREAMSMDDFMAGVDVLEASVRKAAGL